jgi:hypothetical protein
MKVYSGHHDVGKITPRPTQDNTAQKHVRKQQRLEQESNPAIVASLQLQTLLRKDP